MIYVDASNMVGAFRAGYARRLRLTFYGKPCWVDFEVFEARDVEGDGSRIVEQWWPAKLTDDGQILWFPTEGAALVWLEKNGLRDAYEARFDRRGETTYLRW